MENIKFKNKKSKNKGNEKSLLPLYILVLVLMLTSVILIFSDKSDLLSSLFPTSGEDVAIERPEIEHTQIDDVQTGDTEGFKVEQQIEIKSREEIEEKTNKGKGSKSLKARLFYVKVSDEGQISLKSVIRRVNYESAPLKRSLESLLAGPERTEMNRELLNLIPQKSLLLSASISESTAILDFNDEFGFNSLGYEGYRAQLMQIVYTATEFQSVSRVQILIEGKRQEYLGAEGVYVGEPLDRKRFD